MIPGIDGGCRYAGNKVGHGSINGDIRQGDRRHRSRNFAHARFFTSRILRRSTRTIRKWSDDVAEDERIEILGGLVTDNPRIGAARGNEHVFSNMGGPSGKTEEESLHSNQVQHIDQVIAIHISSG